MKIIIIKKDYVVTIAEFKIFIKEVIALRLLISCLQVKHIECLEFRALRVFR